MENIFGLIASCLGVVAGWFIYRNPAKALDFVFGKDDQQHRPIQLFSVFGVATMIIGSLSIVMNLLMIVIKLFSHV